jgi:4a-hydroxytetrahydrobiopterin dehydratase
VLLPKKPSNKNLKVMPALHTKQIKLHLQAIPNWSKRAQTIFRTFKFEGFLKGIEFVNRIAKRAQKLNHHPDIDIRFNQVTLTLTTHDEGGITEKDFTLAKQCDEVFAKFLVS